MDDAQVLAIVDSSTSLDNVRCERRTNLFMSVRCDLSDIANIKDSRNERMHMTDGNQMTLGGFCFLL
jgi:hypothetical protein